MATYSYTHGGETDLDDIRLVLGDHRGTVGQATGWLFSDEELERLLDLAGGVRDAVRMAILVRANREAMASGVNGTMDTTERPESLLRCANACGQMPLLGPTVTQPDDDDADTARDF